MKKKLKINPVRDKTLEASIVAPLARRISNGVNKNIIFSALLFLGIAFSVVTIVTAVAPNPGHNFTESSGGVVQGDLLYGFAADTLLALPKDTNATRYLANTGGGVNNPAWAQVDLTNGITGVLSGANGGTGVANVGKTITLGGNLTMVGASSTTLIVTADSNLTLPAGTKTLVATDVTTLSSLASIGTIITGAWNADVIADGKIAPALTGKTYNSLALTAQGAGFTIAGGTISKTLTVTGDATISGTPLPDPMTTIGDIIIRDASNTTARLGGAAGFLKSTGAAAPAWSAINLAAADVAGILPAANGGTGNANGTANIAGGTLGAIPYQSAANTTAVLDVTATANKVLISGASAAPSWSIPAFPNVSAAARKIIVSDGTNWVASTETYAEPGTAGNLLASDGINWVSATGGVLIGIQVLTAGTTTYIPTPGTNSIIIRLVGGGGGGGGATGSVGPSRSSVGGGGGGGSYAEKYFAGIAGAASYTVAIGAAGAGGIAANGTGGSGGNTTFACPATCAPGAATVTANGGLGGATAAAGTAILSSLGGAGGAVSTFGDINAAGQPGGYAVRFSATTGVTGAGAPSYFGGGGNGRNIAGAGETGGNYGSGGGGAMSIDATGFQGGPGASGVIVVWEFR